MLLTGKLFVPTLATLRKNDPAEARTLCRRTRDRFNALTEDDRECLKTYANRSEAQVLNANEATTERKIFSEIWRREIGKRRCAWCWHAADIESMAQWHVYAKDGVAICSTPLKIRNALGELAIDSGLIGAVSYQDDADGDSTFLRPYLIKRKYYQHEQEVRLVLPREPTDNSDGLLLPVNGRSLISEIRISPLLPHGEALGLRSALEHFVNYSGGQRADDLQLISIGISDAKDVSTSISERFDFFRPQRTGIANFGKREMPFILSDDIRRGISYNDEQTE